MTRSTSSGYSGTPLAQKLGYRPGCRAVAIAAPPHYPDWLQPLPEGTTFEPAVGGTIDLVHVFVTERGVLSAQLALLRRTIRADAVVWISWPKKASKVHTDVTEDVVRELALPLGFVDVKVCAVSEVWSGLKLVVRKALRPATASRSPAPDRAA